MKKLTHGVAAGEKETEEGAMTPDKRKALVKATVDALRKIPCFLCGGKSHFEKDAERAAKGGSA